MSSVKQIIISILLRLSRTDVLRIKWYRDIEGDEPWQTKLERALSGNIVWNHMCYLHSPPSLWAGVSGEVQVWTLINNTSRKVRQSKNTLGRTDEVCSFTVLETLV